MSLKETTGDWLEAVQKITHLTMICAVAVLVGLRGDGPSEGARSPNLRAV